MPLRRLPGCWWAIRPPAESDIVMKTQDPFFKGCARNPMIWGIPMIPFLTVQGTVLLSAMYLGIGMLPVAIPVTLVMKRLCANDDRYFEGIVLRWKIRVLFSGLGFGCRQFRCIASFTEHGQRGRNAR